MVWITPATQIRGILIMSISWHWKAFVPQNEILTYLYLFLGLPGGMTRSTLSSSSSDIKREDKEDDENSIGDKSEEEKKDSKVARSRTR